MPILQPFKKCIKRSLPVLAGGGRIFAVYQEFFMNEDVKPLLPAQASAVLREDVPAVYPRVSALLENAPVLEENCPAVPLVMEDL